MGACPRTSLESFLLLQLLEINSAVKKNTLEKEKKFAALLSEKNSEYDPDMKHFQRAYLRPLQGLNVITSLYLVNIQPN